MWTSQDLYLKIDRLTLSGNWPCLEQNMASSPVKMRGRSISNQLGWAGAEAASFVVVEDTNPILNRSQT